MQTATACAEIQATAYPTRAEIQAALMPFVKTETWRGVTVFAADFAVWMAAVVGVLWLQPLWAKIVCSLIAGLKISNLSSLGHEFAHGTLVRGAGFNKLLAILSFMPGLFNYQLWVYDHHVLHHANVNGTHRDAMTPFSKAEYNALPAHRRLLERIYRAPVGLGFALYEIVERWLGVKFFPRAFMPARVQSAAWPHFIFLSVYLMLFLGILAAAPLYSPTGSLTAILLGFVVPHYVWMELVGFTVYVQHTHPRIAWFDDANPRSRADKFRVDAPEVVSTHIEFPRWLKFLVHNVYDHAVHHVQPRIPSYHLAEAQARFNALIGPFAVKEDFSIASFADTVRRCKLYDYENRRWLDFAGRPTTEPVDMAGLKGVIPTR